MRAYHFLLMCTIVISACGGGSENMLSKEDSDGNFAIATEIVTGILIDSDSVPIPSASITISSDPVSVSSNANGEFSMKIEVGNHHLAAVKDGITFLEMDITVEEGNILELGKIIPTIPYHQNNSTGSEALPPRPLNIQVSASDGQITVTWDPVNDAENYVIHWNNTGETSSVDNVIMVNDTSYTHAGLTNGVMYYYAISSLVKGRESLLTDVVSAMPVSLAPRNFQVRAESRHNNLTWENVPDATSYNIYWNTTGNVSINDNVIELFAPDGSSYKHTELTNGTSYYYAISSVINGHESSLSEIVSSIPHDSASIMGWDKKISLHWPPVPGATSYNVYYSTNPGVTIQSGVKISNVGLGYAHTNLINGDRYYYIITAIRDGIETQVFNELSSQAQLRQEQVSTGYYHTCLLNEIGVICWGLNTAGQTSVPALSNPRQVSNGFFHACAIDDTGVVCWGLNNFGQTSVPILNNPRQISAGYQHTCALDDTGVVCWGSNFRSQRKIPELQNPRQVAVTEDYTCALDDSGVQCWGGWTTYLIPTLINPRQLSVGSYHACTIDDTGVVCWGNDDFDQLSMPILNHPTEIDSGRVAASKRALDVVGHYSRPDVFTLYVNTQPQSPVKFK